MPSIAAWPRTRSRARGLVRSFQVARVFGNLTVRENLLVAFFARARTRGERRRLARASELLRLATLGPLARRPRRNRCRAASACCCRPARGFMVPGVRCYVLDEPFAGINPVVKDTLIDLILRREPRARAPPS